MRYNVLISIVIFAFSTQFFCEPRVVVLGFDGADPQLIEQWIDYLPNIKNLQKRGTVIPIATTNPSHSPVAWATFATGNNPGKHRIFGFLKRNIGQYKPEYAVAKAKNFVFLKSWQKIIILILVAVIFFGICYIFVRRYKWGLQLALVAGFVPSLLVFYALNSLIPQQIPYAIPLKKGTSFWTTAGENNIKTDVIMAPIAFPAEKVSCGHLLCGFGVPDLLGTNGTWGVYSSFNRKTYSTETGGWQYPLIFDGTSYTGNVVGPKNLIAREEYFKLLKEQSRTTDINSISQIRNRIAKLQQKLQLTLPLFAKKRGKEIEISIQKNKQLLKQGQWSDWFFLRFDMSPLLSLHGAVRVYISSIEPEINFYMTPVQFSPQDLPANVQLSFPKDFASKIVNNVGMYSTLGWASATNALKDEAISEEAFATDLQNILQSRKNIFLHMLEQKQDLLVSVFYFTDRASHMYWRFIDKKHPLYKANSQHKLLDIYKEMDNIIGLAHAKLEKDDILLVVSDHGFKSFRWQVNLNTWLLKNGYLYLKDTDQKRSDMQVRDLFERSRLLQDIDWKRTKAYAIGLGKIFINLQDREPTGIVKKEDYQSLRLEIAKKLKQFTFQQEKVVNNVFMQEKVFVGPYSHEAADIVVGFSDGYRVSWQTSLGGVPKNIIEANNSKWSGDHCSVDPQLVPGVFMCNHKISHQDIHLQDLAPSILNIFSVKPENVDGKVIKILNK
ncbi:alkaline phosphatase family protein [Candidatus Uabimicrobium sp. HlEnr_7]|uniref:alkaline phosphatase family protein n=1 Tax=Candidatus Uabimicrobium helgolandensis TaxID=3095367 RepID=UPI0035569A45